MTARELVEAYLAATQQRRLDEARTFLANDFQMEFPGGVRFTSLEELVAWSSPRYRRIDKHYDRFDAMSTPEGDVVYCYGTLFGEWPDGESFEGIRFIDRFTVRDGKLIDQRVWNDLAELRPAG